MGAVYAMLTAVFVSSSPYFGATLDLGTRKDCIPLHSVAPQGPAADAGLRIGDCVVSAQTVGRSVREDLCAALRHANASDKLALTLLDGGSVLVRLGECRGASFPVRVFLYTQGRMATSVVDVDRKATVGQVLADAGVPAGRQCRLVVQSQCGGEEAVELPSDPSSYSLNSGCYSSVFLHCKDPVVVAKEARDVLVHLAFPSGHELGLFLAPGDSPPIEGFGVCKARRGRPGWFDCAGKPQKPSGQDAAADPVKTPETTKAPGVPPVPLAKQGGLVAHFQFDHAVRDEVSKTVVEANAAQWAKDRFGAEGRAIELVATSTFEGSHLVVPGLALPAGHSPRTVALWLQPHANTTEWLYRSVVGWGSNDRGQRFGLSLKRIGEKGLDVPLFTGQHADVQGDVGLVDGRWHHLAATFDGSVLKLYADGHLAARGTISLDTRGLELNVGRSPGPQYSEHFDGLLDDLRVYGRALTAEEIAALYHEGGWQ